VQVSDPLGDLANDHDYGKRTVRDAAPERGPRGHLVIHVQGVEVTRQSRELYEMRFGEGDGHPFQDLPDLDVVQPLLDLARANRHAASPHSLLVFGPDRSHRMPGSSVSPARFQKLQTERSVCQ
jgi:hypothetical protein